jgi:hypothetical protein
MLCSLAKRNLNNLDECFSDTSDNSSSSSSNDDRQTSDPITEVCLKYYPEQKNFLQASTQAPYWLSGQDPLDHVNIFSSKDSDDDYLHYVSLGLSDLHGDERLHKYYLLIFLGPRHKKVK